jgi:mediator of RNA polymerase II transcription subunit 6
MEEDLTGICFKDNRWLEVFPLNKDTALDYFGLSGFYDR